MKLNIENLGKIKKADIELKDLTIICGPNSSNKTWLSYLIGNMLTTIYGHNYGKDVPEDLGNFVDQLKKNGEASIEFEKAEAAFYTYLESAIQNSKKTLPNYFKANNDALSDLDFHLDRSSLTNSVMPIDDWTPISGTVNFYSKNNTVFGSVLARDSVEESDNSFDDYLFYSILFISGLVSNHTLIKPHIVSSERTGALMFQVEVDRSSILIEQVIRTVSDLDIDPDDRKRITGDLIEHLYADKSRLPVPVTKNVEDVRNIARDKETQSELSKSNPEIIEILDKMNGGQFVVEDGEITFLQSSDNKAYKIGSTSSSIKSIFIIDLIIRHKLARRNILLIDEPELNLHPDNQRLMARLIVRLINAGVKVLITTHSDFLVREINNAIALNNDFEGKEAFLAEHEFIKADLLNGEQVSAYAVDKEGQVNPMPISKFGVETAIFDELINKANDFQDEILYKIEPTLFED